MYVHRFRQCIFQPSKKKSHPPLTGLSTRHHIPSGHSLNRNLCLPPVGISPTAATGGATAATAAAAAAEVDDVMTRDVTQYDDVITRHDVLSNVLVSGETKEVFKEESGASAMPALVVPGKSRPATSDDSASAAADIRLSRREQYLPPSLDTRLHGATDDKDSLSVRIPPSMKKSKYAYEHHHHGNKDSRGATSLATNHPSSIRSYKDIVLDSIKGSLRTTSRYAPERKKEFTIESLSTEEARAMSGLLRQASIERLGASRIGGFTASSSSRTKLSNYPLPAATIAETSGGSGHADSRLVVGSQSAAVDSL